MIYSRSSEYALRALTYIAGLQGGQLATVKEISEREGLPKQFLAKLLQSLARAGIAVSVKGPGGGFGLAANPAQITLYDVVSCIDGPLDLERCAVGLMDCSDATPCPLHDEWKPLRDAIERYLLGTNLHMLRTALEQKLAQAGSEAESGRTPRLREAVGGA